MAMPEFVLEINEDARWDKLDAFTQSYIEAMFWTNSGSADDGDMEDATFDELASESLDDVIKDCKDFQEANKDLLTAYYTLRTEEQAGHDFWLTRNRHGAGFWDRGTGEQCTQKILDSLSQNSIPYGERYLYRGDDLKVYVG